MNKKKLDENTIREIGELLLATRSQTASISDLSSWYGISRPTLTKWIADDRKLWELTQYVPDSEVNRIRGHWSRDSRFFIHAENYRRWVSDIRRKALAGEYGEEFKTLEEERLKRERREVAEAAIRRAEEEKRREAVRLEMDKRQMAEYREKRRLYEEEMAKRGAGLAR